MARPVTGKPASARPSQVAARKHALENAIDLTSGLRRPASYRFELECFRGLAILLVFLFHVHGITWGDRTPPPNWFSAWIVAGNTGVTLFFVLSGFLLSLPWVQHNAGYSLRSPSARGYLRARALRILPLYLAWVLMAALVSGKGATALQAATFQFVGFDLFPFSVVWWTLSTEVQFYLLLPLAFWALLRCGWTRALLAVALIAWLTLYLYWVLVLAPTTTSTSWFVTKSLFGRLPAFLAGIALCFWYVYYCPDKPRSGSRLASSLVGLALVGTMSFLLWRAATMGDRVAEQLWHLHHSYEAVIWAGLIALLLQFRPAGSGFLLNRPMAALGKLSYSLYLNHVPLLFYVLYPLKTYYGNTAYTGSAVAYLAPVGIFTLAVACAWFSYRYIELPFLRLKARPTQA